jgi:hypothetical protein
VLPHIILGRRFAEKLMGLVEDLLMPVDHLLFDPLCPLLHKALILQSVPALCVQGNRLHAGRLESVYESDLEAERAIARAGLQYQAAIKPKPRTVSGKTVREVKRALMKIDNMLGLSKLRHDPIPATVPFLDHLLDERHIRARASFNLFAHFA